MINTGLKFQYVIHRVLNTNILIDKFFVPKKETNTSGQSTQLQNVLWVDKLELNQEHGQEPVKTKL